MKKITNQELSELEGCSSPKEWRDTCDAIKTARGGEYPSDWWDIVKLSGMMDRIVGRWGENSSLKPTSLTRSPFKHMADGKDRNGQGE